MEENCGFHEIQRYCAKLLKSWETPSLEGRKQRRHKVSWWKGASLLDRGGCKYAPRPNTELRVRRATSENYLAPGGQREEVMWDAEPAFPLFPIFKLGLLQGNFDSTGLPDSRVRLDIPINVNGLHCQTHWKVPLLLDSLIIGSHWLPHSIIYITKTY